MLRRVAHWCYRKRRVVVAGWVVALIGISVLGQTVGGDLLKTFSLPARGGRSRVKRSARCSRRLTPSALNSS